MEGSDDDGVLDFLGSVYFVVILVWVEEVSGSILRGFGVGVR